MIFLICKFVKFSYILFYVIVILVVFIFVVGWGWGGFFLEMFEVVVVLVVSVIFEGLFVVVIVILAIGVNCMVKCNVIICKLFVVEVLGSVMVVCFDKIGILMEN